MRSTMSRHDQTSADCFVFTFKDGLLSPIAHDLKLRVARFSIEVDDETQAIQATFDTTSLEVVCARKDGRDDAGSIGAGDKKKIEGNIEKDVLSTRRHKEARFVSSDVSSDGDAFRVSGELTLTGRSEKISALVTKKGDRHETEFDLDQRDFGIKPFSAAFGTLKVKPVVKVVVSVPS